jgi:hypothetical protein
VVEHEHVDQRGNGGRGRNGEDDGKRTEQDADDGDADEGYERREADRVPHHVRVDDVALDRSDGHEDEQGEGNDVERLGETDRHDE